MDTWEKATLDNVPPHGEGLDEGEELRPGEETGFGMKSRDAWRG
jgi:hypothetical protein